MLNEMKNSGAINEITNEIQNASLLNTMKTLAVDAVSGMWLELLMFALAIVMYFVFTGGVVKADPPTKKKWDADMKEKKMNSPRSTNPSAHTSPSARASPPEQMNTLRAGAKTAAKTEAEVSTILPADVAKHVALIRVKSKENDLEGAMQVFQKLRASGVHLTPLVYNALLDACVQCGKVSVALKHF